MPANPFSSRPICPHPAEAMPSLGTICSLLLLSVLWVDLAMAGSSFLSPEHQKTQVRQLPTKPHVLTRVSPALPHSSWMCDLGSGSTSLGFSLLLEHKGLGLITGPYLSVSARIWGLRALKRTPSLSNRERSPRSHQPNCSPESLKAGSAQKMEVWWKGPRMSWKSGLVPL